MSLELYARHRALLDTAIAATATRAAFSAYGGDPAEYSEVLETEGREAFAQYCGSYFYLDQPGVGERIGAEVSPFGFPLGIQYPKTNLNTILPVALRAKEIWSRARLEARAGVCLEILHQLNLRSFELAHAVMHTTGAPFALAFRYGGPSAQDRGLEALAIAYQEMKSIPESAIWEQSGEHRGGDLRIAKAFRITGLGVGLVFGCSTHPNWSAYPGFFASLVTGNAVVVKPHPAAILPLAITVGVARHVLKEAGFDPNLVTLVVDDAANPVGQALATRPEVRTIDFTGNPQFAAWIADHARQAQLYAATTAINPVVVDGSHDLTGVLRNLALSMATFSGRMCTGPRVIFTTAEGVRTPSGNLSCDEFDQQLMQALDRLIGDPEGASATLGAMRSGEFDACVDGAASLGKVLAESRAIPHPGFPGATMRSPLCVRVRAEQTEAYIHEWFGPVVLLVECENTTESLARAAMLARTGGAVLAAVYTMDDGVRAAAEEAFSAAGVSLCINFTGQNLMNHSAAFSDFHSSGLNPSGNASFTNSAFVVNRFRVVSTRTEL